MKKKKIHTLQISTPGLGSPKHTTDSSLGSLSDLLGSQGGVEVQGHQEGDLGSQGLELGLVGQSHLGVGDGGLQVGLSRSAGSGRRKQSGQEVVSILLSYASDYVSPFSGSIPCPCPQRNAGILSSEVKNSLNGRETGCSNLP